MAKKVVIAVVVVVVVVVIIAKAFANPLEYARPQQKILSAKPFSLIKGAGIAPNDLKAPIGDPGLIDPSRKQDIRSDIRQDISRIFTFETDARISTFDPQRLSDRYGSAYLGPITIQ